MRGVAALYVVLYHFYHPAVPTPLSAFIGHGYIAVDLFFVLSGFVMALTYAEIFRDGYDWGAHKNFLRKRFARVYPVYILITAFIAALSLVGLTDAKPSGFGFELICNFLLIQTWGFAQSVIGVAWSISVEWAAYWVFPALVALTLRGNLRRTLIVALACIGGIWWLAGSSSSLVVGSQLDRSGPLDLHSFDSIGPMVRCLAGFILGMVAYRFRNVAMTRRICGSTIGSVGCALVIVFLLALPKSDYLLVLAFPCLVLVLYWQTGRISRFMSSRAVYTLGVWSYSLYLVHPKFQRLEQLLRHKFIVAGLKNPELLSSIVTVVPVVLLSALLFTFIERPARDYLAKRVFVKMGAVKESM